MKEYYNKLKSDLTYDEYKDLKFQLKDYNRNIIEKDGLWKTIIKEFPKNNIIKNIFMFFMVKIILIPIICYKTKSYEKKYPEYLL